MFRRVPPSRWLLSPLVLLTLVACGDSGSTGPGGGQPATITKIAGDAQEGAIGAPVDTAPSVRVTDSDGRAVAGATVTFAVASGGGTITGAQQTTNQSGVATVGSWTLGATPGPNTLSASVGTGSASPQTFSATGVHPCNRIVAHAFGTTIAGNLAAGDCQAGPGFFVDLYRFTVPQGVAAIRVNQALSTLDSLDSYVIVYDAQRRPIAFNDDSASVVRNSSARVLVTPGTYFVEASSFDVGETGGYRLSTAGIATAVNGCSHPFFGEDVFISHGVTTTQEVRTTDCGIPSSTGGSYYGDRFLVLLTPNTTVTIRMSSTALDPFLIVVDATNECPCNVLARDDNSGGGTTAQVTYRATGFTQILIDAGTAETGETGAYTLSVQTSAAAALVTSAPAGSARMLLEGPISFRTRSSGAEAVLRR